MKSQDRACSEVFQDDCAPAFQPLLQLKRLAPAQVTFFDRQSSVKQQRKFIGAGCRYGFIYPVTGHLSNLQIVEAERQSSSDSLLNLSHSFLKSEAHLVQPFIEKSLGGKPIGFSREMENPAACRVGS